MGLKERMMDRMMQGMSKEEKREMMMGMMPNMMAGMMGSMASMMGEAGPGEVRVSDDMFEMMRSCCAQMGIELKRQEPSEKE